MKNNTDILIDAARKLLKPSPVRLHHIPKWFGQCLKPFHRKYGSAHGRLQNMRSAIDAGWLDHWGSTLLVRRQFGSEHATEQIIFVSEPYGFSPDWAKSLDALSERTGVHWSLESNSWWYPGHTVRIIIEPPDVGAAP